MAAHRHPPQHTGPTTLLPNLHARLAAALLALATLTTSASAQSTSACDAAAATITTLAPDAQAATKLQSALNSEIRALQNPAWAPGYCRAVEDNIAAKSASRKEGVTFDADTLIATTLKYEAFRITAFRNSGVSPKLYFGFLDGLGKTAAYEAQLQTVSEKIAPILNAYAKKAGVNVTVTPKEIAVTQIAEGGALLLTTDFANVERIHPVFGVGLDDYLIGFKRYPGLLAEVDKAFGTRLSALTGKRDDAMTFTESILGTAVMYLYEKDLAEQKRIAENRAPISTLPLDEQFVHASLVYNSGILFSDERAKQIMAFSTGAYLVDISERSAPKRPKLPVILPEAADALLAAGLRIPDQNTSWNAVYHVLQRYGAWVALDRFSDKFTPSGDFKKR